MTGRTLVDAQTLRALSAEAFGAAGVQESYAQLAARVLVEADLMGLGTHGVGRIPSYCERLRSGGMDPKAVIRVDRRAPSLALVDGHNALGPSVGGVALRTACELAAETGIAYVGCRSSNHFGALAPYAIDACEAGLVMVAGTNASTTMAPFGGKEARIGNNPFGVAAPIPGGVHFILDMAISVVARARIRNAERDGTSIPEGWAVDRDGLPTTDPTAALAGLLLPFGGHKGSGLSMAVDVLAGVITGGQFLTGIESWSVHPERPSGVGHFFILIDPVRLIGWEEYVGAMTRFRETIQSTPAVGAPVILPGQREQAQRAAAMREGVAITDELLAQLRAQARGRP